MKKAKQAEKKEYKEVEKDIKKLIKDFLELEYEYNDLMILYMELLSANKEYKTKKTTKKVNQKEFDCLKKELMTKCGVVICGNKFDDIIADEVLDIRYLKITILSDIYLERVQAFCQTMVDVSKKTEKVLQKYIDYSKDNKLYLYQETRKKFLSRYQALVSRAISMNIYILENGVSDYVEKDRQLYLKVLKMYLDIENTFYDYYDSYHDDK